MVSPSRDKCPNEHYFQSGRPSDTAPRLPTTDRVGGTEHHLGVESRDRQRYTETPSSLGGVDLVFEVPSSVGGDLNEDGEPIP